MCPWRGKACLSYLTSSRVVSKSSRHFLSKASAFPERKNGEGVQCGYKADFRSQANLCLDIDRFLNKLLRVAKLSPTLFHLGFYQQLGPFAKHRMRADSSETLSASNPITYSAPDCIPEHPRIPEVLSPESLKLDP